jgi:hypothetical protein
VRTVLADYDCSLGAPMNEPTKITISGGTFFLCGWLFLIAFLLASIAGKLQAILEHMK